MTTKTSTAAKTASARTATKTKQPVATKENKAPETKYTRGQTAQRQADTLASAALVSLASTLVPRKLAGTSVTVSGHGLKANAAASSMPFIGLQVLQQSETMTSPEFAAAYLQAVANAMANGAGPRVPEKYSVSYQVLVNSLEEGKVQLRGQGDKLHAVNCLRHVWGYIQGQALGKATKPNHGYAKLA